MNKALLISCLFLTSSAFAGEGLLSLPGSVWGRFDYRTGSANKLDLGPGRGQGLLEQGVQLNSFPHIVAYGALEVYEPAQSVRDEFLAAGVKNTTLLRPFQLGVERRFPQHMTQASNSRPNEWVAYVSLYKEWDLSSLLK